MTVPVDFRGGVCDCTCRFERRCVCYPVVLRGFDGLQAAHYRLGSEFSLRPAARCGYPAMSRDKEHSKDMRTVHLFTESTCSVCVWYMQCVCAYANMSVYADVQGLLASVHLHANSCIQWVCLNIPRTQKQAVAAFPDNPLLSTLCVYLLCKAALLWF